MEWDEELGVNRFLIVQERIFTDALSELRAGKKKGHWMWFVFPQVVGLGSSFVSMRYSIQTIEEAEEYMFHPILGFRLIACAKLVCGHDEKTAEEIFGIVDAKKLCSSMTLFANLENSDPVFRQLLDLFFEEDCEYTKNFLFGD